MVWLQSQGDYGLVMVQATETMQQFMSDGLLESLVKDVAVSCVDNAGIPDFIKAPVYHHMPCGPVEHFYRGGRNLLGVGASPACFLECVFIEDDPGDIDCGPIGHRGAASEKERDEKAHPTRLVQTAKLYKSAVMRCR